jgi:2-polyprenyl-6-methoxyphenol hydroxylase-like FAD-dependent oxidoreductase
MNHAIVIGGSMGGLLAARVLSDHYQQVTILERDAIPPLGENRRGVPQGRHTHGLLASGRQVLDRLFPGFTGRAVAAGAVYGDIANDSRWFTEGGCLARFKSGLDGILLTRPLLEGMVRGEVRRLRNVAIREGCDVDELTTTQDRRRVTGIRLAGGETLAADLVLDASGRGSAAPRWLEAFGYEKPAEERIEVGLAYTTRFFRRRKQDLNGDMAVIVPPTPEGKRGGVLLAQEGNRWTLTLISHFGPAAPTDLPGFIEFTRSLPSPDIHEVVRSAEPLGEAASARFPHSLRRRYERLDRFPEGYLVFGDAISSFNPIYGQGMSVAALESVELQSALAAGPVDLARRFFSQAARVVDIPWSIAAGNDLRMPEAVGPRNAGVKFINWYMAKLHRAAQHDPALALAFHRVANLLEPPPSVMRPANVIRVALGNLRRRRQPAASEHVLQANAAN